MIEYRISNIKEKSILAFLITIFVIAQFILYKANLSNDHLYYAVSFLKKDLGCSVLAVHETLSFSIFTCLSLKVFGLYGVQLVLGILFIAVALYSYKNIKSIFPGKPNSMVFIVALFLNPYIVSYATLSERSILTGILLLAGQVSLFTYCMLRNRKQFILAIIFFTIASLIRNESIIYILVTAIIFLLSKKLRGKYYFITACLSILIIFGVNHFGAKQIKNESSYDIVNTQYLYPIVVPLSYIVNKNKNRYKSSLSREEKNSFSKVLDLETLLYDDKIDKFPNPYQIVDNRKNYDSTDMYNFYIEVMAYYVKNIDVFIEFKIKQLIEIYSNYNAYRELRNSGVQKRYLKKMNIDIKAEHESLYTINTVLDKYYIKLTFGCYGLILLCLIMIYKIIRKKNNLNILISVNMSIHFIFVILLIPSYGPKYLYPFLIQSPLILILLMSLIQSRDELA